MGWGFAVVENEAYIELGGKGKNFLLDIDPSGNILKDSFTSDL